MPWRGVAPVQLVIAFIGTVLLLCMLGMILLSTMALVRGENAGNAIPNQLATVSVASMTAMAGLLAPNTGLLTSGRTAKRAEAAGQAAEDHEWEEPKRRPTSDQLVAEVDEVTREGYAWAVIAADDADAVARELDGEGRHKA